METFSALLAICVGNSPVSGEIPAQRPAMRNFWCFFWSANGINGWINNREAGDLSRHLAHYDVTVMETFIGECAAAWQGKPKTARINLFKHIEHNKVIMSSYVWDEIIHPFPNLNDCTVEVLEWISYFIPHLIIGVIFIHAGIKVFNPC